MPAETTLSTTSAGAGYRNLPAGQFDELAERLDRIQANPNLPEKHHAGIARWTDNEHKLLNSATPEQLEKLIQSLQAGKLWVLGDVEPAADSFDSLYGDVAPIETTFQIAAATRYNAKSNNRIHTLTSLAEKMRALPAIADKRDGFIIYPGHFDDGVRTRELEEMYGCTAATFDFDGRDKPNGDLGDRVTRSDFEAACRKVGVEVITWLTHSAPDDALGCTFRALMPYKNELAIDLHRPALAAIAKLLGMGPQLILPATQGFFLQPRPGVEHDIRVLHGKPIDTLINLHGLEPEEMPAKAPCAAAAGPLTAEQYADACTVIDALRDGGHHHADEKGNWHQFIGALAPYGDQGAELAMRLSEGGKGFSERSVKAKIRHKLKRGATGIGRFFELAGDLGIPNPGAGRRPSAADDFADEVGAEDATAADILGDLILNTEDMKGVLDAEHIIPSMVIRGHVGVYPSPPGGGKTTLFIHFCEEMVRKGYTVYYFNVDSSPEMLDYHLKHAQMHGYNLIAPDMKKGKGLKDAKEALRKLTNLPAGSLKKTIIIIDTLKKFVSLLNKEEVSGFFKLARAFNAKGATVCILGHTNKYHDAEGNLVFEGVGDVLSDIDEMIYLYSSLDRDTNIRDITTDFATGKVRAKDFKQRSFRINLNKDPRTVEECAELLPKFTEDSRKVLKVTIEIIGNGTMSQKDLLAALMESTPFGRDKIRTALHDLSAEEYSPLKSTRNRENNSLTFSVRKPRGPVADFSDEQ